MSLLNFFKKSDKKRPSKNGSHKSKEKQGGIGQQSPTDNPLTSPEQQKERYDAAMEFLGVFQQRIPLLNGKPHAGTVMSVAARLAGTSLFRSINKKGVDPGVMVLSEDVNQAYPQLLNLFAFYCKKNGIDVMVKPLVKDIPEQDKPLMELPQVQAEYQDQYNAIMQKHGLNHLEAARAGMVLCSIVFHYHCVTNKDIDPYVATGIVAMDLVEAVKTSPVALESGKSSAGPKDDGSESDIENLIKTIAESSVNGSGKRLFLGEQDATIRTAQDNAGKFVLVHPEVASKLKQGGIDPYLIYITALIVQMESKIPRIDFVDVDVDTLFREWGDKSKNQAPIHVRQLMWLKANAERFGYQRSGNSWKLN